MPDLRHNGLDARLRFEQRGRLKLLLDRIVHARQLQQRRSHRRRLHRLSLPARRNPASHGRFHDQRHMHRSVVDKKTVLVFSVFTQRLAVIAEHDNQRGVVKMILPQPSHQVAQFMIRIGNLAIVEMILVLGPIGFGRIVWTVRIVKMQPEKERPPRRLLQPCEGVRDAFARAPIHQSSVFFLECLRRKRIVVEVEAARQPPAPVEHERAHDCSRRIPRAMKGLRHGAKLRPQRLARKILHPILKGIGSGENHGVRGPSQRNLRNRPLKHHPVVRQRIERGGLHILRAIAPHMIRAHRIDGYQYNAWL